MSYFLTKNGYLEQPLQASFNRGALPPGDLTEVDHHHDFDELVLIGQGTGRHVVDGRAFAVKRGDVFLIRPGQRHYFSERRDMQHLNLAFDRETVGLRTSLLEELPGYHALFILEPRLRQERASIGHLRLKPRQMNQAKQLFDAIVDEQEGQAQGAELAMLTLFEQLLLFLCRCYEGLGNGRGRTVLGIAETVQFIETHHAAPISLEELYTMAAMSRSSYLRTFRSATGLPPIDYLNNVRISHAMELLAAGNDSITDIAFAVGFNDSNYFTRQFRKVTGLTPRAYRRGLRLGMPAGAAPEATSSDVGSRSSTAITAGS